MRYIVIWITYFPIHVQVFSKRRRQTKSEFLSKQVFNIAKRSSVKFSNCCLSRVCTSLLMVSGSESRPGEICNLLTAFKWESKSWISWKKVGRWKCYKTSYWVHLRQNIKITNFEEKFHPKYASYFLKTLLTPLTTWKKVKVIQKRK